MKRIGPELKMPKLKGGEMKVPPFLSDLYTDLRERRLLPLLGLIVVAIVATPILLGSSEEPEPLPPPPAIAGGSTPAAKSLTVVKAEPGLRNYKKRLDHRRPTDPFKQRFTAPQLKGARLNAQPTTSAGASGGSEAGGASSPSPEPAPSPLPPVSSGGGSGSGEGGAGAPSGGDFPSGSHFYTFALDVQVTRIQSKPGGGTEKTGPTTHKGLKPPSVLPGEKAPVVTYIGVSTKTRNPLFLVSPEVQGVYGEGKCVAGTGSCQLIELEPKFPETFVYGAGQVRYKINVLAVEPVALEEP